MRVDLAYGRTGLAVEVPDGRAVVVRPSHPPAARDQRAEVRRALREPVAGPPLVDRLAPGRTVAIAICDGTRAQPRDVVVPVLLDEIEQVVDLADVVVLVATGTHRANTPEELQAMLGRDVLSRVRVVNHDARDPSTLVGLGTMGRGVPVELNREFAAADVRVTTGFVEPHFFAGFSGGPKLVTPGLAGLATTLVLHDASRIGDPRATWGVLEGNPVHDDVRAIASAVGVHFACDVVLDASQRIVKAFGGDLAEMHASACALSREVAMQRVPHRFPVVVTSNAGYPLDQNLYQAVKGMSAAAGVVSPGGVVVVAAECADGFPDHGSYRSILESATSPSELLASIEAREETVPDQWQVQVQARVQSAARVAVRADGVTAEALRSAHLEPVGDLSEFVAQELERAGPDATCCVLPEGPLTIPYLG
ncbi:MAG: nickel-dependent lactate racemase [Actinomycetota bacterium]|nr:nickel-dependent lactate racemase [Actinomycetota bacterium]